MKYIFFDTESSNCYGRIYKMCEFGSITVDSSFRLFLGSKKDILINPGRDGKFNLGPRRKGREIHMAHAEEEYFRSPTFETYYDNIRFLLSQKDTLIFLWAGENDIQALLDQCYRYKLPKISFTAYDVQTLFRLVMGQKTSPALDKAAASLDIDLTGITAHRPDDDSMMTMYILKALCGKTSKTVEELIQEYPRCKLESLPTYRSILDHRAGKGEQSKANLALNVLLNRVKDESFPAEKTFAVSGTIKKNIEQTLPEIQTWEANGYRLQRGLHVPYLVYYDEAEKEGLTKALDLSALTLISRQDFDALTKTTR